MRDMDETKKTALVTLMNDTANEILSKLQTKFPDATFVSLPTKYCGNDSIIRMGGKHYECEGGVAVHVMAERNGDTWSRIPTVVAEIERLRWGHML
jgi:hypothetical protein